MCVDVNRVFRIFYCWQDTNAAHTYDTSDRYERMFGERGSISIAVHMEYKKCIHAVLDLFLFHILSFIRLAWLSEGFKKKNRQVFILLWYVKFNISWLRKSWRKFSIGIIKNCQCCIILMALFLGLIFSDEIMIL